MVIIKPVKADRTIIDTIKTQVSSFDGLLNLRNIINSSFFSFDDRPAKPESPIMKVTELSQSNTDTPLDPRLLLPWQSPR